MTADHLWHEDLLPFGSARYYALLQHPDDDRARIKCILQLQQQWSRAGFSERPTEAVWLKLDWWRDELQDGRQRHPLSQALAPHIQSNPALREQLLHMLKGYRDLARNGSPGSDEENHRFHYLTGACASLALANGRDDDPATQMLANVGVALSRWRCLRYLRRHVACGLLCLPQGLLNRNGIKPADLQLGAALPALREMLGAELQAVQGLLQVSCENLLQDPLHRAKGLYVYTHLQLGLAKVIAKSGANLMDSEVRLTPLKNHWHAGRAGRLFNSHLRRA